MGTPPLISRRHLLQSVVATTATLLVLPRLLHADPTSQPAPLSPSLAADWLKQWEKGILGGERHDRYCDKEMGEELGWLVSPYLNGFAYGYLATGDTKWIDLLINWSDAWTSRGIKEPDGYIGWPKDAGASTPSVPETYTDNILGEAMALTPMILIADKINKTQELKSRYGAKAKTYLELAEQIFTKWESRGCWRLIKTGGVWVVPTFGIDKKTNTWTDGYDRRDTDGFSLPANKQNAVAIWLLALHDATSKPIYKDHAEKWFQTMKSRMRLANDGKTCVWNYWDPAGPWDYKSNKDTRHWVGVHPNGGYYGIDLEGIVAAFQHKIVFDKSDIDRLIVTNRDYMWDQNLKPAHFKRIDAGKPDPRWKDTPGVLWSALVPYDPTLRKIFEANHKPDSWGGIAETPRYLFEMAKASRL